MHEQTGVTIPGGRDGGTAELFERALLHMEGVQSVMPKIHLALKGRDAERLGTLWRHLRRQIAMVSISVRPLIGDDRALVVLADQDVIATNQDVRLLRCDKCHGIFSLSVGGVEVGTASCDCARGMEEEG